jgi:hypothetical protein
MAPEIRMPQDSSLIIVNDPTGLKSGDQEEEHVPRVPKSVESGSYLLERRLLPSGRWFLPCCRHWFIAITWPPSITSTISLSLQCSKAKLSQKLQMSCSVKESLPLLPQRGWPKRVEASHSSSARKHRLDVLQLVYTAFSQRLYFGYRP